MLRDTGNSASGNRPFIPTKERSGVTLIVTVWKLHIMVLNIYRRDEADFEALKGRRSHPRRI